MKEFRKKHGLSQSDIVRLLGYYDKASVSNAENSDSISQKYVLALKALVESMQLMTDKIEGFYMPSLVFAKKKGIVRRVYSNSLQAITELSESINRKVIFRKKEIYKYEIIVF